MLIKNVFKKLYYLLNLNKCIFQNRHKLLYIWFIVIIYSLTLSIQVIRIFKVPFHVGEYSCSFATLSLCTILWFDDLFLRLSVLFNNQSFFIFYMYFQIKKIFLVFIIILIKIYYLVVINLYSTSYSPSSWADQRLVGWGWMWKQYFPDTPSRYAYAAIMRALFKVKIQ